MDSRLSEITLDLNNDFPDGEVFEVSEYVLGITKKHWICGTEKNENIQLVALFEQIDFKEFDRGWDDNPYSIMIQCSMIVHPKHFSIDYISHFIEVDEIIEYHDGKYPISYALLDAYMYGGGIPFNPDSITSSRVCNVDSEIITHNNCKLRHFKNWEDADKYIREIYIPHTDAVMGLVGFYLDRSLNRVGTTGWDFIYNMTEGTDWLQPALDRAKEYDEQVFGNEK